MSKLAAFFFSNSWFVDGPRLVDLFADSKLGAPAQKAPWSSWNEPMPASLVAVLSPKTDLYPWSVWYVPFDPGRTGRIDQRSARMAKIKWSAVRQQRQLSVISSRKGMASHQRQAQVLAWTCNRMCAQLVACVKPFFRLKLHSKTKHLRCELLTCQHVSLPTASVSSLSCCLPQWLFTSMKEWPWSK